MKEDETKDGTREVKQNHIQQDHVESNPLYEITLDNIAVAIERAIKLLKESESIQVEMDIYSAYLLLYRLHENLTKK